MIDYGLVDAADAQTIGVPGERTFRIRAQAGTNRASLWLEKEQLSALGHALSQLLAERARPGRRRPESVPEVEDFDTGDVDLHVARMGIDFVEDAEHVVLLADDRESIELGDTPAFRMEITRWTALALIEAIPGIVAAGRPTCPLCGRPLEGDGEHFCPRTNGHSKDQPLPSDRAPT